MKAAAKIVSFGELLEIAERERRDGRTIALANGIFDILHVGHLRYLESSADEGDLLVVGINSDASARRLKGSGRPITPGPERAELLAGFTCVRFVTIFDGDTVEDLLRRLRPDVHCKGTDYTADSVPEAALARSLGIRVAIVGDAKEHSTRQIIRRMRDGRS